MFISCKNSKCKNYFEDSCMINLNNKVVFFDEEGHCENFEEGTSEGYTAACNECEFADNEGEGFRYCNNNSSMHHGDCVEDAAVICQDFKQK